MKNKKESDRMQEIIDALKDIRNHQPNGELKRIEKCVKGLATKVDDMHNKIMDPENGLIVQTNKNTEFRTTCEPEREVLIDQFKGVLRWKKVIEWGLGVVFVAIIGTVIKIMLT
jgi:t-SNARE complex subunit (syntaxin)